MSFLRIWVLATGGIIGAALLWSFAPILIPVLLVAGGLGLVVVAVIAAVRFIEGRLRRPDATIDMQPGKGWRDTADDGYHQQSERPD